ncbi:hypothetical protein [Aequorivita sinensis]|uniref:hypothetical protein n=1 Tax=Aequorivita sinensis TaxID=1382458 RepID=UPI0023011FB2|nr:hypothetical protein [Aequorivita sinensis]
MKKLIILGLLAISFVSCQFSETLVMNEDGSGNLSVEVNLSEMMAFSAGAMGDSVPMKLDTIVYISQFLEEKKDSIATLSATEQKKLKALENYNIGIKIDSDASEMVYNIATNFKDISEANNIHEGLSQVGNMAPNLNSNSSEGKKKESSEESIGVLYTFNNGVFKRDAYIKDEASHKKEVDSLKNTEAFLSSSKYTLNYTFPRKIKKASNPKATFSADQKTVILKESFIEYFKNPDLLDLEIELEK